MAVAMERLASTPTGKNQACFSSGDNQPATTGDTPSGIAVARMRSQVLVELPSSVKPNATPVPVIAASPAVTTGWPLGRAIVTAHPSRQERQSRVTIGLLSRLILSMGLNLQFHHVFFLVDCMAIRTTLILRVFLCPYASRSTGSVRHQVAMV